jgi:hypothetical protein
MRVCEFISDSSASRRVLTRPGPGFAYTAFAQCSPRPAPVLRRSTDPRTAVGLKLVGGCRCRRSRHRLSGLLDYRSRLLDYRSRLLGYRRRRLLDRCWSMRGLVDRCWSMFLGCRSGSRSNRLRFRNCYGQALRGAPSGFLTAMRIKHAGREHGKCYQAQGYKQWNPWPITAHAH